MVDLMTAEPSLTDTIGGLLDRTGSGVVFGAPITQDGVTVVPVARISTCGGGELAAPRAEARPMSCARLTAKPAGAYVITGGKTAWRPAVDINRIILGGQVVAIVALLTLRAIVRARRELRCRA
jgi:hypothetical protein